MKKNLTLLLLFCIHFAFAQSTEIRPGIILPQMTTVMRTGLLNPANGSLVFDTNTLTYWYRQPGMWIELKGGASYWTLSGLAGNEITNSNTGGFWSKNPATISLAANNNTNPPTAPTSEAGTRLMWIPSRSAFRVGTVTNNLYWSAPSIGLFSFATGLNTAAVAKASTAMGYFTSANGEQSTALGSSTYAGGIASTAMGYSTEATGDYSTALGYKTYAGGASTVAMGSETQANGNNSTALGANSIAAGDHSMALGNYNEAAGISSTSVGYYSKAGGNYSIALGKYVNASGLYSTAMGNNTIAGGDFSTTMGNFVNTTGQKGSFAIGDADPTNQGTTFVQLENQYVARFYNGYFLLTSGNATNRTGVQIGHGETSWSAISDSTRKEKFVAANGESFLLKLRDLRLGSWNYKGQGANPKRFYGPMAQEIYAAFGKDKYGTIGNDTTVSTINMDGLLFIFSQALEKRTQDLQVENHSLKAETQSLKAFIQKLDARLEILETNVSAGTKSFNNLNK